MTRSETTSGARRALLVVDVQPDFCEGGTLAVEGGTEVARRIARYVHDHGDDYDVVATTQDWHVDPGDHFASSVGVQPDYTVRWPDHCRAGTEGAALHPLVAQATASLAAGAAIFLKGEHAAAYSGFEGHLADDEATTLSSFLHSRAVEDVDIVGLTTDYCVRTTALDARREGFRVRVLLSMSAPVSPEQGRAAIAEMEEAGVECISDAP